MDILVDWGNAIWAFFGDPDVRDRSVAIATVVGTAIAALVAAAGLFEFLIKPLLRALRRKPDPAPVAPPVQPLPVPAEPMVQMTLAQFEAKQREIRDAITDELKTAGQEERAKLQSELDAVNARLREPQKALKEAQKRVADLEAQLDREAQRFGADRIAEAKAALAELDYSKAEELFEIIRADATMAIDAAARAEFGLGEIAEARVDWAKAATHYGRAADLAPDYDRLKKASEFAWRAGDYASADRLGQALLDRARGEGTQEQLSGALNAHAGTLRAMGRYEEAEPLYRQALDITKDTLGTAHPNYAIRLNNLGNLLSAMGRYEEAEPLLRQALDIDKDTLGTAHPDYATGLNNLGNLLRAMGRYEEAERLFRQALDIDKDTIGTAHPDYAIWLNNHGKLLHAMGRYEEAEPLLRQALDIGKGTLGTAHPNYAIRLHNLAALYADMGRYEAAAPLSEAALGIFETALPAGHPHIDIVRGWLADIRAALAKAQGAQGTEGETP